MSTSSSDEARSSIEYIKSVVPKVRDIHVAIDFERTSERLRYLLQAIEKGRKTGAVTADNLDAAMLALLQLIKRAERIIRMELQRSLGDRTWNRSEIRAELDRLRTDISQYLGSQVISAISERFRAEERSSIPAGTEEIMTELARLDKKDNSNAAWPDSILRAARERQEPSLQVRGSEAQVASVFSLEMYNPSSSWSHEDFTGRGFGNIGRQAKRTVNLLARSLDQTTTAKVVIKGLKHRRGGSVSSKSRPANLATPLATPGVVTSQETRNVILELPKSAKFTDLHNLIKAKGYRVPTELTVQGECIVVRVSETTSLDPLAPGGLQISLSMPVLHYFNKYLRYHGLSAQPSTTPGHTLATLNDDGVVAGGVEFQFHRTLRVPDNAPPSNLPASMGVFPLEPVTKFGNRVPEAMRKKGGFIMPMFKREAMWMSFHDSMNTRPAVKVSVGGVNAVTGVANSSPTPPNSKQDYIVAGLQPWLDGIMTASRVVRQAKSNMGGLQFDIFPVRDREFTVQNNKSDIVLAKTKTPAELSLAVGAELRLTFLQNFKRHRLPSESFVTLGRRDQLSNYLTKAVGSIVLDASYPSPSSYSHFCGSLEVHSVSSVGLGFGGGGKITQRIYQDTNDVRIYDEDSGQRLFVHVVTPKEWELITGIIAPITPISASRYKQPNVPWFRLSDGHASALSADPSGSLSTIKSVARLDAKKQAEPSHEIDPDHPPSCSKHSKTLSVCVFRPCSHTACSACLGAVMMLQMKCLTCEHKVERIVGMKDTIVVPTPVGDVDGLEWDVSQMEELASLATGSKNVSIIHLREDRVPRLHASKPTAFGRY
ncbi:hypothetical protein PAXINDRAFT_15086 [Paxillus involutus ATCC 200175]|uniref:RING-type domain-containing protein n=1 Tax=Paxillus involutus ATCC 200175 TaxID=664439 RepID=A0A0C9T8R8_PAXIN|nr:hypothetical protein PAXINDRAFT_15086 [Paxillus involutus ATCC 200175]